MERVNVHKLKSQEKLKRLANDEDLLSEENSPIMSEDSLLELFEDKNIVSEHDNENYS